MESMSGNARHASCGDAALGVDDATNGLIGQGMQRAVRFSTAVFGQSSVADSRPWAPSPGRATSSSVARAFGDVKVWGSLQVALPRACDGARRCWQLGVTARAGPRHGQFLQNGACFRGAILTSPLIMPLARCKSGSLVRFAGNVPRYRRAWPPRCWPSSRC